MKYLVVILFPVTEHRPASSGRGRLHHCGFRLKRQYILNVLPSIVDSTTRPLLALFGAYAIGKMAFDNIVREQGLVIGELLERLQERAHEEDWLTPPHETISLSRQVRCVYLSQTIFSSRLSQ